MNAALAWLGAITRHVRAARYRRQRQQAVLAAALTAEAERLVPGDHAMPGRAMPLRMPWPCSCVLQYRRGGEARVLTCDQHEGLLPDWKAWESEMSNG